MDTQGTLSDAQWRAVERIEDILAQTADLREALVTGLDVLRKEFGCPGAALYLPRFCEHLQDEWTYLGVPDFWENSGKDALAGAAARVMQSGRPEAGVEALALGAALPVHNGQRVLGALLVHGAPTPAENYPLWAAFLRPFARFVTLHASISGNTTGMPSYMDLMRSRNTLRAMFDSLPISIYIIDAGYNLVAINKSRSNRVGEIPSKLVGRRCYEVLYHRGEPCQGCLVGETFATGRSTVHVSRTRLSGDTFQEWEVSSFPIFDENGQVIQAILVEQDVTEKRNLEANLIQSEKLAAVGQLAAGVAHEINNPLTAIIANAQILRHEIPEEDSELLDSVKLIEMAGRRASQVVRNLLGIARKEKYEFEPIDLNETVQSALALVQHELVGRSIKVNLDLAADMPRVLVSYDQLQGVWINLVLNAIDAIDKEEGQINIVTRYADDVFQVIITDNGKGIPPDYLPRLFEPFFTTKSPGRGTGLGLSVCQRVIRQHGGNISVDSQYGKWTRFTVSLPGPR